MKALYFDCFSGISGDMTLGALIGLGVDHDLFKNELKKLNLEGYDIIIEKSVNNGITGTNVHVVIDGEEDGSHEHSHEHGSPGQAHAHEHNLSGSHHEHEGCDMQEGHSHTARNLRDIEALIDDSGLKQNVKAFSKKVFEEIARAEAKVHNKDIYDVHFHEVGAVDSIIDIVGAAICLDILGVQKVFSSPLHDGHGFIKCQHGILPVPVPAVMEMLADSKIPYISEDINTELVTPTGIGIIKSLTNDFGNMPAMIIDRTGYGMGKRDIGRLNALRVVMGTLFEQNDHMEEIAVLETNIDDMSSEVMGYAVERLMESGALDVFYTPIYMKKNRPAVMLTVLARKENEDKLAEIILRETSTLGIRRSISKRYCMDREIRKVDTQYGEIRIKVASAGGFVKAAPEYEDCREAAKRSGQPLQSIYDLVREKSRSLLQD